MVPSAMYLEISSWASSYSCMPPCFFSTIASEFGFGISDASMYAVGSAMISCYAFMLCDSIVDMCALKMFEVIRWAISQSDALIFII